MAADRKTFDLNRGALAPVADEVTLYDLAVDGHIPDGLNGLLVRNGPNPFGGAFDGATMLDWWVAPSMVHGLAIGDGQASWYRNRWPRNDGWAAHHNVDPQHGIPTNTNVNVIAHGNRLMALGEGALPAELGPNLDTIGAVTFDGRLPNGMMAHPKVDPSTGSLHFFRADWQEPYLQVGTVDDTGVLVETRNVELERPVMMHDFAITDRHDVILDLNVVYDFSLLSSGVAIPLRWDDNHRSRIGVVARDGQKPMWFDVDACFVQHVVNAYRIADPAGDVVVIDVVRYREFLRFDHEAGIHLPNPLGVLWRFELNLTDGTSREHQLDDHHIELPRIDDRVAGRLHRRLYAVEQPTDAEMRGIRSYDLETGTQDNLVIAPGDQNSEPIFVPDNTGTSGADERGWLLVCVYRATTDTTDVLILDAMDLSAAPQATIHLPRRIPAGFHGTWVPDGHPSPKP